MNARHDLLQHFLISAAITSSAGAKSVQAVGLAKELHDAEFGSGFSFADWCADLPGLSLAKRLQSGRISLEAMSQDLRIVDFLPDLGGLPEGLSQKDFRRQFGSASDPRFRLLDDDIRRRIEPLAAKGQDAGNR